METAPPCGSHGHFPDQAWVVPELKVGPSRVAFLELQILTLLERGSLRPQLGFEARSLPGSRPSCLP